MFRHSEMLFDTFNHALAVFDKEFRDVGKKTYSRYDYIQSYDDGEKVETYKNGKIHGKVTYHNGKTPTEYYIEGRQVDKEKWEQHIQKVEDEKPHYITIDNREYTVTGKELREIKNKLEELKK